MATACSTRVIAAFRKKEEARQRWAQKYGAVPPAITAEMGGHRIVMVGNRIHHSPKWKTFHDYLLDYIKWRLGPAWGDEQLKLPEAERHPIATWYQKVCAFQKRHFKADGAIHMALSEGVVGHYLRLAYDLYSLQAVGLLEERLVGRLKGRRSFQGALYELTVAAACVRAGFKLELEDESDPTTTHCEFALTGPCAGARFSVEAKSRHRSGILGNLGEPEPLPSIRADVDRLIKKALLKKAHHQRIVFIDVNVPPDRKASVAGVSWAEQVAPTLRRMEETQSPDRPWPSAFFFFTNRPQHYLEDTTQEWGEATVLTTINMPEFADPQNKEIEGQRRLRAKHPDIFRLFDSLGIHTTIPHEFGHEETV